MKLDYNLKSLDERLDIVNEILENETPNEAYLEKMADYLIFQAEKQEKKILTDNRMVTIKRRETSLEGLASSLENEDGIYNIITNDKDVLFYPKREITEQDLQDIPELKQLRDAIDEWKVKLHEAKGIDAYIIKKMIIDMQKDQYIIKSAYKTPVGLKKTPGGAPPSPPFNDTTTIGTDQLPAVSGFSLMRPDVVSLLLQNYSKLKQDSFDNFEGDIKYIMFDLDNLIDIALAPHPLYLRILERKIDGASNLEIQHELQQEFGDALLYNPEYISSIWCKRIPKLIASSAIDQYLDYYYTEVEKGQYKKCSHCGQIKLMCPKYFSRNNTSKDGYYSICKECRRKKVR